MFRTLIATAAGIADTAVLAPLIIGASFVSDDATEALCRTWARTMLAGMGVELAVEGLENLDPKQTYVYTCNHQSHVDPPCCYVSLPGHLRFVAKESLFKIPVFGQALRATGQIPVDRGDGESSHARINESIEALRTRVSVIMFPEGTRSDDGVLKPFKKGPAVLALQAQVPLVPMAIVGSKEILPKGWNAVHAGKVRLRVGKPIPTAGLTLEARGALTERLREAIAALMVDLKP